MIRYPSAVPDNSQAELSAFDDICARLSGFEGRLGFEYVDGWLTGLASGPVLPPWEQWMPLLCGDAFERAFGDPEDASRAQRALTARLSVLRQQLDPEALLDHPDLLRLSPSLADWEPAEDGGPKPMPPRPPQPAELWAMGAIDAILALRPSWPTVTDADALALQEELVEQIDLLINLDGIEIPGTPDDGEDHATRLRRYWPDHEPSRDDLIAAAGMALQDLRVFWIDHAPKPEQRRVEPAPGRNDPCPCGSGKKYKKCHGMAA